MNFDDLYEGTSNNSNPADLMNNIINGNKENNETDENIVIESETVSLSSYSSDEQSQNEIEEYNVFLLNENGETYEETETTETTELNVYSEQLAMIDFRLESITILLSVFVTLYIFNTIFGKFRLHKEDK